MPAFVLVLVALMEVAELAPGYAFEPDSIVAVAVYAGHRYAREFENPDIASKNILRDSPPNPEGWP